MDGNISYVFLPFSYHNREQFLALAEYYEQSGSWNLQHDEIRYLFRFVAEKMDSTRRDDCRCFHYTLSPEARLNKGFADVDSWYVTERHSFNDQEIRFRFQIPDLELFCFSTGVCILLFKLHFAVNDPYYIASAQYYLKKVSRERITVEDDGADGLTENGDARPAGTEGGQAKRTAGQAEREGGWTILGLAKNLMKESSLKFGADFFFYAFENTERANMLTCLEVEPKEDYSNELFFLRRCYTDGFQYVKDSKAEEQEVFRTSRDILWGVSPEAAICLTMPDGSKRKEFFTDTFYVNFSRQYLYMYVLLLHRKYTLYMLLTKIGVGMYNDIDRLEAYRNELYEFETDFVFSRVTEVQQYQMLYDHLEKVHYLKKLYEDVREPLVSLSEVRRQEFEKKEKERDDTTNYVLIVLAFFGIFSALIDSFDFFKSFLGKFMSDQFVWRVQKSSTAILMVICIYLIIWLFKRFKH